jgi:hypothetical protein
MRGARFVLECERDDGARAVYRARVLTPDATYDGRAALSEDGSVELSPTGAPGELDATLVTFAKLVARAAANRRAQGLATWPPRVTRWRDDRAGMR